MDSDLVAGKYTLGRVLGEGGMAIVYEATNVFTKRRHALKLVKPRVLRDKKLADMFVREAQVGGRIGRCPYIVDVTDAGFVPARRRPA